MGLLFEIIEEEDKSKFKYLDTNFVKCAFRQNKNQICKLEFQLLIFKIWIKSWNC